MKSQVIQRVLFNDDQEMKQKKKKTLLFIPIQIFKCTSMKIVPQVNSAQQ